MSAECWLEEMYERATPERRKWFWENFVEQVDTLTIQPHCQGHDPDNISSLHREEHKKLIESIRHEGIKVPITIVEWNQPNNGPLWTNAVWEGRHRVTIAWYLRLPTVPALRVIRVGGKEDDNGTGKLPDGTKTAPLHGSLKMTIWEFADTIKRARKWNDNKA